MPSDPLPQRALSLTVARVAGIPVRIHATFLILVAWVGIRAAMRIRDGAPWKHALVEAALLGLVFVIVALHELGHALVARRFGVKTKDITLLPIGGVARLDHIPKEPRAELLIALGGPMVNVGLAAFFFALAAALGLDPAPVGISDANASFVVTLAWVNVSLAVFNLVPAFPMDGGRALRALLALRMGRPRATRLAARIGRTLAVLLGLLGLSGNPMLVFIALFVWVGAGEEAADVEREAVFANVPAARAMMTELHVLGATSTLGDAAALVVNGWQRDFPVRDGGVMLGVLTRDRLIDGLARLGPGALVTSGLETRIVTASPVEPLNDVVTRMREENAPAAFVMRDGALVGMITPENMLELYAIASAQIGASGRRKEAPG